MGQREPVERTQRYAEDELAGATDIWQEVPRRLVLITRFQRAGQASTENLVVVEHVRPAPWTAGAQFEEAVGKYRRMALQGRS